MSSAVTQYTRMFTARLPHDLAEQLLRLAEQRNQKVTRVIEEAVRETVRKEVEQPADQQGRIK